MTQVPAQYALFPTINATLNGASAVLLFTGHSLIKRGRMAAHRAVMIAAVISSSLFLSCYLYYHAHVGSVRFQGTRLVAAGIFYYSDFAYDSGNRDCAAGDHYSNPRAARALRPPSRHRSLDIPPMAVCFNHRGCDLRDAVSPVCSVGLPPRHGVTEFSFLSVPLSFCGETIF